MIMINLQEAITLKIIPLSELRDTKHISDLVSEKHEPIFVTKQGASHIVVMHHDDYVEREDRIKALEKQLKDLTNK